MDNKNERTYKYQKGKAFLTIGYDISGRIFSGIEKNGKMVAKDMYIRIPSEVAFSKQGWIRIDV